MVEMISDYTKVEVPKEEVKKEEVINPRITSTDIGNLFKCYDVGIEFEDADIIFNLKESKDSPYKDDYCHAIKLRVSKREMKKMFEHMYLNS